VRRVATLAACLAALLGGCRANPSAASAPSRRGAPPGQVTPAFQGMRSVLSRAQKVADTGDMAALRRSSPEIVSMGIGLLRSNLPNDLHRADVPRFLEGRAAFGDALKAWSAAADGPDDAALRPALQRLVDAFWGWVDAYKGLPPERAV
jgi:hypothetical protein